MRVPLTTKHAQLDTSKGTHSAMPSQEIDDFDGPSQFTAPMGPVERLPKFKIDLFELQRKNLSQKPQNEMMMEESTGIGLMLSKR